MTPKNTLVFIHIPKTAGSTLHSILPNYYDHNYYVDGLHVIRDLETFKKLTPEERNNFDVVRGHFTHELLPLIENKITLTYLRDPVDRFLSAYFYLKQATWSPYHETVKNMNHIDEFITFSKNMGRDNVQTRHLAGDISHFLDSNVTPTDFATEGDRLLNTAKENLNSIDFVFLTKQFDASLLILKKELGWNKLPVYKVQNKTKARKKVSEIEPDTLQKIKELNKQDVALFEAAKIQNETLMKQYDLTEELASFLSKNRAFQAKKKSVVSSMFRKVKKKLGN